MVFSIDVQRYELFPTSHPFHMKIFVLKMANAQTLNFVHTKVHRMYTEGTVPFVYKDNVFFCIMQIIVYFSTCHLTQKVPHLIKKRCGTISHKPSSFKNQTSSGSSFLCY